MTAPARVHVSPLERWQIPGYFAVFLLFSVAPDRAPMNTLVFTRV